MAEENKEKVEREEKKPEEKKTEPKKLEDYKTLGKDAKKPEDKDEKSESSSAVAKDTKKTKKEDVGVELEREYVVPLRSGTHKVPRYKRAKKAIKVLKEFLAKHMKVEDRDLNKVKIDMYLNNELWHRGIKKPANKIKVKAVKKGGIVYAELAEVPQIVLFEKAKIEKRKTRVGESKKPKREEEKDEKTEEEKKEEEEDRKAGAEKAAKVEKAAVKAEKHTAKAKTGKQEKVAIRRKAMKR